MIGNYITYRSSNNEITVADILREHWDEYRASYAVTPHQAKVVGSVLACRTPALGGRLDCCQECGAWVFRFNSCRDRHCNQCQKYERAQWVDKQKIMLLPIPYFHMVFTVDHLLNPLIQQNQREFYELLFKVVSKVLQRFAKEELSCELGITAVLHTWGQQIDAHYHLHCIVTGGGLSLEQKKWVRPKSGHWLFNVVKLSAAYRDELLGGLRKLAQTGQLSEVTGLDVGELLQEAGSKKWEVFAKAFEQPEAVYEYLSRYVHQVALSNHRLEKLEAGYVTFRYYDNRERAEVGGKGKEKVLRLSAVEFIRRWLQHILPLGFRRIRYYGLHHSSARKEKLPQSRAALGLSRSLPEIEVISLLEWLAEILGESASCCPQCGAAGSLQKRAQFRELPWLLAILLALFGQPTKAGVNR